MYYRAFSLFHFLTSIVLQSLVPTPGLMDANAPVFIPNSSMSGVRVVRDSSIPDESGGICHDILKYSTKPSEV